MQRNKKSKDSNEENGDPDKTPPHYQSIPIDENEDEEEVEKELNNNNRSSKQKTKQKPQLKSYTAPKEVLEDITLGEHRDPLFNQHKTQQDKSSLLNHKRQREPSPARNDPLSKTSRDKSDRGFKDIMNEQKAKSEQAELLRRQQREEYKKARNAEQYGMTGNASNNNILSNVNDSDMDNNNNNNNPNQDDNISVVSKETKLTNNISEWDKIDKREGLSGSNNNNATMMMTPRRRRWDINTMETPVNQNSNLMDTPKVNRDLNQVTPLNPHLQMTPTPNQLQGQSQNKTKLDETPNPSSFQHQSLFGGTPTPGAHFNIATPTPGLIPLVDNLNFDMRAITLENIEMLKYDKDLQERNRSLADEEIDLILPSEGYEVIQPPENYIHFLNNYKKNQSANNSQIGQLDKHYQIPLDNNSNLNPSSFSGLKPDDLKFFSTILNEVDESKLSQEELRERNIMALLLKVKNGAPPMRKSALRQITEKAREFGAGPLFNQIIPLLMSPSLEDQERHLLVKVIDRILFKLDDLIRPYVHKILVAIMPMLRDENSYARIEGREIISNLAKSAGLATMISTMRPDIDSSDESIRSVTSKAFAVVASALGLPSILPFLKAVCQSKKSWLARDTGIKIVQQIAILIGCAVLPYLKNLVEIISNGLIDEQLKIRTFTALALAALAEAAYPYGIEAFQGVAKQLFDGIKVNRGKTLTAFFKAIGYMIPLMEPDLASRSANIVIPILKRDFNNPDENTKKIVLKVLKQCISTEGINAAFIRLEIEEDFFLCFWNRRMALDRKNYKSVIEVTVEIANKITCSEVIERIVLNLKDESEIFRRMTLEAIHKVVLLLGLADVDKRLEQLLINGLLFAFQEQSNEESNNYTFLNCFGTVVTKLGLRIKPYISSICKMIQWGFQSKNSKLRQQSAELIVKMATSLQITGEETVMCQLGVSLNENLGEEYPEVLGSILAALKAIVGVIGLAKMTPPIKDLLPKLTPILKNRHEKVQENVIDLIGLIADKGANYVSPKEWMRISFDLLDLLKAHKKIIRRATVNTFGYIAKAIGPQEVLITLLNNLKVQERQNRVCTTVAIAIVSETCGPYTVIPALMNEYRVPELNVQNGVLKSIAFLFEYIGEMARDYIYAVIPILEDALTERDLVHRQIAASAIRHLALGVAGLNCEDGLIHLLNYVWPNIFETSPHVVIAVMDALEGLRVGLGVNRLMAYVVQGLFHPARRVRDTYWKIYNMIYIGSADAMTACYPRLPDDNDKGNSYAQVELELFI